MSKNCYGWKAFRLKDGKLEFLFHGLNGSKQVPVNQWIKAKQRLVHNPGAKDQPRFRSAFHFMPDKAKMEKFDLLTKGKYLILPVAVRGIVRPKPRSNVGSWLATELFVSTASIWVVL